MMLMIAEMKKYDAIYCRQSAEKEDSLSIETQMDIAKRLCTNEIRYYRDPGWSGGTMNRPDLKRLFRDIETGIISKIVVYRLDRLSRTSMFEFFSLIEFLSKYKVGFVSATEPFDTTTPMGEYMMLSLAGIARLERQNISARILDNVDARVKRGYWIAGTAPYGFDNAKLRTDLGHSVASLKANSDMKTTLYILNTYYYEADSSLGTIRDSLNANNILTARGKRWSGTLVQRRIYNPAPVRADLTLYQYFKRLGYVITSPPELWTGERGCLLAKKKDECTRASVAVWEGYIDSHVWIGCLEKANRKKRSKRRGTGKLSWLLGICKCGHCGYSLTGSQYESVRTGTVRRYAYCSQYREKNCIDGHGVSFDFESIENMVQTQLIQVIDQNKGNPPIMNAAPSVVVDSQKQLRLIKLEEELENFLKIIAAGAVSKTTLSVLNVEIEKRAIEKESIEQEIEEDRRRQLKIPAFDFKELNFEDKKMVARAYISEILIFSPEHMQIKWNV